MAISDHERPTSEWEHSHAISEGDVLVHEEYGEEWEVTTVEKSGNVRVRRVDDGRRGPNDRDAWSEKAVRSGLAHGEMYRKRDGLSHELATF
jgi:hypothetical protein